ncbi:MAG: S-adenosylmethionine decarboxylase [Candidatus Eisenbacteria bacterium]
MHKGKYLLIGRRNVMCDMCFDDKAFLGITAKTAERADAIVMSQPGCRFGHESPAGIAAISMLDESHCSGQASADSGLTTPDIFMCSDTNPQDVFGIIQENLVLGDVEVRTLPRLWYGPCIKKALIEGLDRN